MTGLGEISRLIGNYLELHGYKGITSMAKYCGAAQNAYTFHLHNLHEGSIGMNPYTGADHLDISK